LQLILHLYSQQSSEFPVASYKLIGQVSEWVMALLSAHHYCSETTNCPEFKVITKLRFDMAINARMFYV